MLRTINYLASQAFITAFKDITVLDRSTATQSASTKAESGFNLDFNLPMSETQTNNFSKAGGA